ncbi:MAG: tRNA (adenosine(37)-N6)-dimethylallyltransferase MiaA [Deltaproteobacteria bacterium RIFOXYD12_FULL_50_9]|nr:MAG: tRNA (adenosine(37)-N6)-dimethylallyltransferase MiaA [Deltaproteobacteria bacterium RIFOXYD12_FULL_50_9]
MHFINLAIDNKIIALIGPTGIGKTKLSLAMAEAFSCEIVSVDSMQIYRFMDIGTAKATHEERQRVQHHLIDIVDPDTEYNLARYIEDAQQACNNIAARGKTPLLVGGTGLYLKGLLEGVFSLPPVKESLRKELQQQLAEKGRASLYSELQSIDPESAARIHPNDTHRLLRALEIFYATGIPWAEHQQSYNYGPPLRNVLKIGLTCDREELYQRINARVTTMIEEGFLQEVQKLLERGYSPDLPSMKSLGYRHLLCFISGEWSWDHAAFILARDTRRYAKRQFTWFHKDESINWFNPQQQNEIFSLINNFLMS